MAFLIQFFRFGRFLWMDHGIPFLFPRPSAPKRGITFPAACSGLSEAISKISVLTVVFRFDCFRLIYLKTLHQPAKLLTRKRSRFSSISWPLVSASCVKPFVVEDKSVFVKVKCFNPIAAFPAEQEQGITVWIQLICHFYDGKQTVN